MHILETYSLLSSAKIDKPFIVEQFYPLPDKYITIHGASGMPAKNWDYFQDLLDEIHEPLKLAGYEILQIGSKDDKKLEFCQHLLGLTSINQTAYILKNSSLHIGNDSFAIHICSANNIPVIGLYSISPPSVCGPYWKSSNQICLESKYDGKPSYNPNENPKVVNTIKLETIINSISKLLNIKLPKIETLQIGYRYLAQIVELIPNKILNPKFAPEVIINIRADLLENLDENIILTNIKLRKCSLIINKEFKNLGALQSLKENLVMLFYDITDIIPDINFIEKLNNVGLKPTIVSRKNNKEKMDIIKLDILDWNIKIITQIPDEEKIKEARHKIEKNNNVFFKSNRIILSDEKIYLTIEHWRNKINTTNKFQKITEEININKFLEEEQFLYLYTKN